MRTRATNLGALVCFAALAFAVMVALSGLSAIEAQADCLEFLPGQQVGTVESGTINEASGLAASRANADVLWVHNDSGDSARVFAMDTQGRHLGIYDLAGAGSRDWEDMAVGPGPVAGQSYLYMGDIGDNAATRSSIQIHRVAEPTVSSTQAPVEITLSGVETITLTYPDGARDAEALMVDPVNGDIYVVSKREAQSRVYRAAYPQSTTETTAMEFKGELPWGWATGGDISPTGQEILIRGYVIASHWPNESSTLWEAFLQPPCSAPLISEPQGESICYDANGFGYFTVSEGSHPPIYYFERVPEPSTLALLSMGALTVTVGGWRRRRAA